MERHEYYMEVETMEQNMEHIARGETRDKVQRETEDLNIQDNEREYLGDRGSKLSAKERHDRDVSQKNTHRFRLTKYKESRVETDKTKKTERG